LDRKVLRKAVEAAVERMPDLPEWADAPLVTKQGFASVRESLVALHNPRDEKDIDPQAPARRRLAYDEFLAGQVSLALVRQKLRRVPGTPIKPTGEISGKIRATLPFTPTNSQLAAIDDILKDMASDQRMLRLVQGDVGAGKTLVALFAMAAAVEAGGQAVLMAPTEILARQHHATLAKLGAPAGLKIEVLTGRTKGKEREAILERIADRRGADRHRHACPVPGCRQLHEPDARRRRRAASLRRASAPAAHLQGHLAAYAGHDGDADPAHAGADRLRRHGRLALTEKPAGPQADPDGDRADRARARCLERLRTAIAEGKKAYWICPLVEETEESELMSARGAAVASWRSSSRRRSGSCMGA
jgi:ATP-dependent DNA helicase RecG